MFQSNKERCTEMKADSWRGAIIVRNCLMNESKVRDLSSEIKQTQSWLDWGYMIYIYCNVNHVLVNHFQEITLMSSQAVQLLSSTLLSTPWQWRWSESSTWCGKDRDEMRAWETSYWPCSCWCRRPLRTDPSGRMRSAMPSPLNNQKCFTKNKMLRHTR